MQRPPSEIIIANYFSNNRNGLLIKYNILCQLSTIAIAYAVPLADGLFRPHRVAAAVHKTRQVDRHQKQDQRNHR